MTSASAAPAAQAAPVVLAPVDGPAAVPGGPGGPAVRRRITDAWARLGTLTPAAGWGATRRPGGADPAAGDDPAPSR